MERIAEKTIVKKPDAEKPRAKITRDDKDTIIVIFMPDGRQLTFRMKRDHA